MKAIAHKGYGRPQPRVLDLGQVDVPVPEDDQVLVRVRASSVNPVEWYGVTGPYFARLGAGFRRPKDPRLGADLAGVVEATGREVRDFAPGDEVFGAGSGAWAEYALARATRVGLKPANISFEEAATVPVAGLTALQALRDHGQVQPGQKVLINGASGGVGTFAVQLAKAFGVEVTGVCSTTKVELVRSIGADRVIDYTREDFADGDSRYDVILDIAGNRSLSHLRRALAREGTLVLVGGEGGGRWLGGVDRTLRALVLSRFVRQGLSTWIATQPKEDLEVLHELLEAGKVTPVVDRTFPLSEVPEAIRYLREGRAHGKVVITV
jgi:NADPH:quinone reductase-like Zn-dependent oxidoreductase